ncbi:hypothetical protein IKF43_00610 [Candidatus Saccharibacteria bacterium]|nr:hypothetical protein [Candidatus Saccharibacteria bacterium]
MERGHLWVAVIAGGQGTRLFPISHLERPKQFCQLDEHNSFIQAATENFKSVGIKPTQMFVVTTNDNQLQLAKDQCLERGVLSQNIKEFNPSLGYAGSMIEAAKEIYAMDPEAIIINTPSDQYVDADDSFYVAIEDAVTAAKNGKAAIVCVKVNDIVTAMGCGHAVYDENSPGPCFRLTGERFIEKPVREIADKLMRQGNSAVNTGINVWKAKLIVDTFANRDYVGIETDELMDSFGDNIEVSVGTFKWRDCGTLKSLYEISKKSANHKNVRLGGGTLEYDNCRNSLLYAGRGMNLRIYGADGDAVIATSVNEKTIVVIAKLSDSQKIKLLAEDYYDHAEILSDDFSMGARNNMVLESNISDEVVIGFVGVNKYAVYAHREPNGEITIVVSQQLTTKTS